MYVKCQSSMLVTKEFECLALIYMLSIQLIILSMHTQQLKETPNLLLYNILFMKDALHLQSIFKTTTSSKKYSFHFKPRILIISTLTIVLIILHIKTKQRYYSRCILNLVTSSIIFSLKILHFLQVVFFLQFIYLQVL